MGISGLIGAGASDGLDEVIIQQLAKQKFAEQVRAQQAEEAQRAAQMAQQGEQFNARMAQDATQFQGTMDSQAANRRQRSNEAGVEDMMRQHAAMQPKPVKLTKITTKGPDGKTVAKGVTDEELAAGVEEYREPKATGGGGDNNRQWLMRGGKKVYGINQPGDEPYEKGGQTGGSTGPSPYAQERSTRTRDAATNLMNRVSKWTTGPGSMLSGIPATDARDFAAALDTLKGNIAFNELAQMREASKTGGALGAVSDKEMRLLESTLGALDAGQSPAQFKQQLQQIIDSMDRFDAARTGGAASAPALAPSHSGGGGSATIRYERGPDGRLRRVP